MCVSKGCIIIVKRKEGGWMTKERLKTESGKWDLEEIAGDCARALPRTAAFMPGG